MASAGRRQSTIIHENLSTVMQTTGPGFNYDYNQRLKWATQGSTIHLISNCEDVSDWDISSTTHFDAADEAVSADVRDGSNSIEIQSKTTTTGSTLTLDDGHRPNDEDWSDYNWLCLWIHDDTAARTAGELKIQIRNNGDWCTALSVPVTTVDMWQLVCIDISAVDRNNVDGFRFYDNRSSGSTEKVYVDHIFVTDLITGVGDAAALCTGPVIGPVRVFPVTTGQTILPGDTVEWAAMGVSLGTANDARIIGVACQHDSYDSIIAADATPKEILVACEGSIVWMRNDGSGMAIGDSGLLGSDVVTKAAGSATANAEYAFCMSLETSSTTAYASGDSAYQIIQSSFDA